jgi:hypothetical protein
MPEAEDSREPSIVARAAVIPARDTLAFSREEKSDKVPFG